MYKAIRALAILGAFLAPVVLTSPVFAQITSQTVLTRNIVREEANRQLVLTFYNRFFNKHETVEAAKVIADDYIQHNPQVPNGKEPFLSYFTGFFKKNPQSRARIVRSATDGDLVYLHIHSTNGANDRGRALVDIFRVDDGKIVEHWDVIQPVPEHASNKNTMF